MIYEPQAFRCREMVVLLRCPQMRKGGPFRENSSRLCGGGRDTVGGTLGCRERWCLSHSPDTRAKCPKGAPAKGMSR